MLILTRRVKESLLIGDDIVITITKIRGQTVRVAVDAPSGVNVGRIDRPPLVPSRTSSKQAADQAQPTPRLAG